jgi:hypothetical protein
MLFFSGKRKPEQGPTNVSAPPSYSKLKAGKMPVDIPVQEQIHAFFSKSAKMPDFAHTRG